MDDQRINIWERKLLDLTMGNALINTKYGANCMQAVEQDGVSVVEHPGTYKLGILFDGRGYYRIPMTLDRELVQPMVLEHLGWNLAKVWQEEYFRHPEEVTRTIVELLKKEHLYSQK